MSSIKKNISFLAAGNTLYSLCLWLNVSAIAKLTNAESVGMYALCASITSPAFALLNMNMRLVYVTDVCGDFQFGEYLMSRKTVSGLLLFCIILMAAFLPVTKAFACTLVFVAAAKYFESLSDMRYGYYQKNNNMSIIATSQIIRGMLGFFLMLLALWWRHSIALGALGQATAWGLVYLLYDRNRRQCSGEPRFNGYDAKKILDIIALSLPLGIIMMINLVNTSMPRYFVAGWLGERQLGFFAAISYFLFIGSVAVNATGQAVVGRLAEYFNNAPSKFKKTLGLCLLLSMGVGSAGYLVSLLIGKQVLAWLYTEEYSSYASLLSLIMLSSIPLFVSTMLGSGLTATRKFKYQAYVNVPIPFIIAAFYWLLRDSFSLNIAVYSLMLAFSLKAVAQFLMVWRLVHLREKKL